MLVHLQAPLWTPPTLMKVCIFVIHETWSVLRHTARKIILGWKQEIWEFSKWKAKGRIFLILWKYSTSPNHSHCAAEDNAETVWFIQRGHHGQLQRHMSSIQKHLSLHLLMHGLYHSHADRKCRVYCALEQGSLFDWILVLTTVKSAGHSVPNHFSQLPREKVSGPARNRWTWKSCPPQPPRNVSQDTARLCSGFISVWILSLSRMLFKTVKIRRIFELSVQYSYELSHPLVL